jgi:hypothetical protein
MDTNAGSLKKRIFGAALVALSLLFLFLVLRRYAPLTNTTPAPASLTKNLAGMTSRHALHLPHRSLAVVETKKEMPQHDIQNIDSINLQRFGLHQYLMNFAGLATYHGAPCANASILIRIATADGSQTVGLITKPDGTYATQILVESMPKQPIDWIVEGYTPEFKKVEIVGRRIGTDDDDPIGVEQEVAFLSP